MVEDAAELKISMQVKTIPKHEAIKDIRTPSEDLDDGSPVQSLMSLDAL